MIIKTIIIDDEPLAASIVKEYLKDYPDITIADECLNGFEGLKSIQEHQPELIFLDVQMPKINGFEMLELIDTPPAVIFTTAFDEYAIKAFEAHAVDYLLKPFSKERFDKTMRQWMESRIQTAAPDKTRQLLEDTTVSGEEIHRIVVKSGNHIRIIPVDEIQHIEAYDDYVKIFTPEDVYLKKQTMSTLEAGLNPQQFVRVHRSYILPVQHITKIESMGKESHIAILKNGSKIPLSKTGFARLKEVLGL